jgi:hypothetical protein
LSGNGGEVHQLVHGRQVGNEAPQLGLALFLNKQVSSGLATPEGTSRNLKFRPPDTAQVIDSNNDAVWRK